MKENLPTYLDSTKPMVTRTRSYAIAVNKRMNPVAAKDFNPETFDPMEGYPETEVGRRERKLPPARLPTKGMKPKEIREGQMVGMYETKQDLYLLIAWLSERVTDLEEELKNN